MHHDAKGTLPPATYNWIDSTFTTPYPGNANDRRCWLHDILPYIEQGALFSRLETHLLTGQSALAFTGGYETILPTMMCPSDPTSPKTQTFWGGLAGQPTQGFSGNFVVCAGSDYFNDTSHTKSANLDGMLFALSKTRLVDVSDGLSNTALVSELILTPDNGAHDIRGRYFNPAHSGVAFSTIQPPNMLVPDQINWCNTVNPLPQAPCVWTGQYMFVLARSYHTGGVNVTLADGSARFITRNITPATYKALGSRNGGEPLSANW
jgi:prepilin-type processing-associated H-X9-DG protein